MAQSTKKRGALIYDFDGTLAPGNMQEQHLIPDLGTTPDAFWDAVGSLARSQQIDPTLAYMHLLLQTSKSRGIPFTGQALRRYGERLSLFPGVETWFDRINSFSEGLGIELQHFLISTGNSEIIDGVSIRREFHKVYASKYIRDSDGVLQAPGSAINYTNKTQFLFRINRDAHDLSCSKALTINGQEEGGGIPFENMIFIGDGPTDVPCFNIVKHKGGTAIAVHDPAQPFATSPAYVLLKSKKVRHTTAADYRPEGPLNKIVSDAIGRIAQRQSPHLVA